MATVKLAPGDVEALFALIYELRDMPVQTRKAAEALRVEHEARRRKGLPREKLKASLEPAATSRRPTSSPGDGRDLGLQVADLRKAFHRWTATGEPPPSIAPTLIQFILTASRAEALEKAFLAAFCYHFGADHAERYNVVVDRALELGAYPLPMVAAPVELPTAEAPAEAPQALFDAFELEGAGSAQVEFTESDASHDRDAASATGIERNAAVPADDAEDVAVRAYALQHRRRQSELPLAPDSRLIRKAKSRVGATTQAPSRRGFWGLFDGVRR